MANVTAFQRGALSQHGPLSCGLCYLAAMNVPRGHELYSAILFGTGVALVWGGLAAVMLWAALMARG